MVHFDAFGAFSTNALVHFESGIQVHGGWGFQNPLIGRSLGIGKGALKYYISAIEGVGGSDRKC